MGTLALCAGLVGPACSRPPSELRGVVLISLDTLRADRMSLYGGPRRTTPVIDALAREGVTFTQAYSPAPWTLPAHAALLTGRYPESLSSAPDAPLYRLAPMLSTVLQSRGFETAAVTGGGFVSAAWGADVGFEVFHVAGVERAIDWLQRRGRAKPFFLFFHTYVAHLPYRDFRYVQDLEGGRFEHLRRSRSQKLSLMEFALTCGARDRYSDAEKEFVRALYDGGVAAADELVGRILEALRERGLFDEIVVVVTSDHGEEFWDHTDRAAAHGHTLYNELLRVPLVWYEPGLRRRGATVRDAVSLIDVVPTLLARLGITAPGRFDGTDLSPMLEGKAPADHERPLFAGTVRHGPARRSVIATSGKLIVNGDTASQMGGGKSCPVPVKAARELYLPSDPAEGDDQAERAPGLVQQLEDRLASETRAQAAAAASSPRVARAGIDAPTRERLENLGYVE